MHFPEISSPINDRKLLSFCFFVDEFEGAAERGAAFPSEPMDKVALETTCVRL